MRATRVVSFAGSEEDGSLTVIGERVFDPKTVYRK